MRIQLLGESYQLLGMPFGWAMSPWWSNRFSRPIRAWMMQQGMPHAWWVDDVAIFGPTKAATEQRAAHLIQKLTELGIRINVKKSMTEAQQVFPYVGQMVDLRGNQIHPLAEKLQGAANQAKHQMKGTRFQPKNLAALAGTLIDLTKGVTNLQGLPQRVMQFAGRGAAVNAKRHPQASRQQCWGKTLPKAAGLQRLLQQCLTVLQAPISRVLRPSRRDKWTITSDSSDYAWGAQLCHNDREIATCSLPWDPMHRRLHITHKEATASAQALQHFLHLIPPGAQVKILSDAISTVWSWRKGSKILSMNTAIAQSLTEAALKKVHVTSDHIPGTLNRRADWLSRHPDPKNYQLDRETFLKVCRHFRFFPNVDLFASRANKQCKQFCSWRTDPQSLGNAFQAPWNKFWGWMNPPWELMPQCIQQVREQKATVLACLPVWKTKNWWGPLQELLQGPPLIVKGRPLYRDPDGNQLPPPRWATLFGVLRG